MTQNIDLLNDLDPLNMTREDIDALVLKHRRNREAGGKPKKEAGPKQELSLAALGLAPKPVKVDRRF